MFLFSLLLCILKVRVETECLYIGRRVYIIFQYRYIIILPFYLLLLLNMEKELLLKVLELLLSNTENKKEINETVEETQTSDFIGEYVILRWYDCGVVFWKLDKIEWKSYYMSDCRRLYYWKTKWLSLEDVATKGLEDWCKISDIIKKVQIVDERISMLLPTTEEVTKNILEYKAYVG